MIREEVPIFVLYMWTQWFCSSFTNVCFYVLFRTLIPILHQKAKRGTPHQAKQAIHCIHAIFNNKEVQLAQIFEVRVPFISLLTSRNILCITTKCAICVI